VDSYSRDAEVLSQIGEALFPQDTKLTVRLPRDLADLAVAAWLRDDTEPAVPEPAAPEPAGRCVLRQRAAYLALIGLSVANTGRPEGDEVVCELDAWYVGGALEAADRQQRR
jgi:hypothetical protein